METQSHENSQHELVSSSDADNLQIDAVAADLSNHRDTEQKSDVSKDEVIRILQVIASTGKYWHDWDNLKSMLSFQLKQVLSEYPEAKMTSEQQFASLGESYSDLANKLDEALKCFIDGPPFTLQRLCEILLHAKNIYPNISKLALALEKNLLVTSTLTICTDPYPQATVEEPDEQEKAGEEQKQPSDDAQNGIEPPVDCKDVVMAEAEAEADTTDTGDDMTIEVEASEDVKSSENNSEPNADNA